MEPLWFLVPSGKTQTRTWGERVRKTHMERSENDYDAVMGLLRPVDPAHPVYSCSYPLSPISPRVTYILCKQGLGDLRHHTDGIPSTSGQ